MAELRRRAARGDFLTVGDVQEACRIRPDEPDPELGGLSAEAVRAGLAEVLRCEGLPPDTPYWVESVEGTVLIVWIRRSDLGVPDLPVRYVVDLFGPGESWRAHPSARSI